MDDLDSRLCMRLPELKANQLARTASSLACMGRGFPSMNGVMVTMNSKKSAKLRWNYQNGVSLAGCRISQHPLTGSQEPLVNYFNMPLPYSNSRTDQPLPFEMI